ncbi:MAG TPA: methyltransferase domain-containing protein [Thermoanaerobaculia bacterium]|nr:methyltransferase domain-containing protein [Thermoanaerobaculia bacterium]
MVDSGLQGTSVWKAPLALRARYDIWRQGGRRVYPGWATYDDVTPQLAEHGVEILPYRIDVPAFWRYVEESGYRQMAYWEGGKARAGTEKWLEHFVSIDLLRPRPSEVFVDIASCSSPFPDILRERWGCRTYRQDWSYPPGSNGDRIGGDAAALPLPAEFADGLTLHCSFDHFEGDRDQRFLREAERILRPGGRLCILPLYTNLEYCLQTDLAAWQLRRPGFERDALICVADNWGEVHCRFYDPAHFIARILGSLSRLRLCLYRVENYLEVAADCYLKLAAVFSAS